MKIIYSKIEQKNFRVLNVTEKKKKFERENVTKIWPVSE